MAACLTGACIAQRPIFDAYPGLKDKVACVEFADLPTPVMRLSAIEKTVNNSCELYLKDDGKTGTRYGGNKVRKLEFLLADALKHGAKAVVATGGAGSNYTTAVSAYAPLVGLKSIVLLKPQVNVSTLRSNLLLSTYYGADIRYFKNGDARNEAVLQLLDSCRNYYVLGGGSNEIGTIGYVNAAFELKKQIDEGLIQEPDYIYVACGSMGTAAGLMLGLKAAGLKTRVVCVPTIPQSFAYMGTWAKGVAILYNQTSSFLHDLDEHFCVSDIIESDVIMHDVLFGGGYVTVDQEEYEAIMMARELEDIKLEGTYAGKAFAALMRDIRDGKLNGKKVLFWKTNSSADYSALTSTVNYKDLPQELHVYFETDVQPLDVGC